MPQLDAGAQSHGHGVGFGGPLVDVFPTDAGLDDRVERQVVSHVHGIAEFRRGRRQRGLREAQRRRERERGKAFPHGRFPWLTFPARQAPSASCQIRTPRAVPQVVRQRVLTAVRPSSAIRARPAKIRKPGVALPVSFLAKPSDEAR